MRRMMELEFIDKKEQRTKLKELRNSGMDFLRELIGMDWGDEGLGVIYLLENSSLYREV